MRLARAVFFGAILGGACAPGASDPAPAGPQIASAPLRAASADPAAPLGGHTASPRFIRAVGAHPAASDDPAEAARAHLERFAPALGASSEDLGLLRLHALHDLGAGGSVAWFRARGPGADVYPGELRVLLRPDRSLVAVSGELPAVADKLRPFEAEVSARAAVALAATDVLRLPVAPGDLRALDREQADFQWFRLAEGHPAHVPEARAKPLHYVHGGRVEPAWMVELYAGLDDSTDGAASRYIVSAASGALLDRRDLTLDQSFDYRVWAESTGDLRPADGPIGDFTPHPSGIPDGSEPALAGPAALVRVPGGLNTSPQGPPDPWLAGNAAQTVGNNVDAYTDDNAPDGFSNDDLRATRTGNRAFDHAYDLASGPVDGVEQRMASVTSLFFVTNWLHDYWYDSGFDELAGNAQLSNYGRGGLAGDVLRAEAQDGHFSGQRNNANMSTPSDGMSPRMQMYTWTGASDAAVTVGGTDLMTNVASFGPTSFDVTAAVVLVDDGAGTPSDGCEPFANAVSGRIALVDRGACSFAQKTQNAQNAGAVGVILANDRGGSPPRMGGSASGLTIGILSITESDGNALKASLQSGSVTARLRRVDRPERDGALDHMVVAHEWGHYLHNRLADCGTIQCRGMGEGWADFLSLHTSLREGDDLEGAYPVGIWATRGRPQAGYFGIRRVPYSVEPTINALSFRHIQNGEPLPSGPPLDPSGDNARVHNTGEVWASMLFEAYVGMLRTTQTSTSVSFEDVRRRFSEIIVGGLMLTPRDATFTEQRDALLAAASVRSATDLDIMARAFAARGAGTCAVSPPRSARDNVGVVEARRLQPVLALGAVTLSDAVYSCDQDGVLDAEEEGRLQLTVSNAGPVPARGTTLTVTSTTPGLVFSGGTSVNLPDIAPYETETVTIPVDAAASLTGTATLTVTLRAQNADACAPTVTSTVIARFNVDDVQGRRTDDVEANTTPWTTGGRSGSPVWSRESVAPLETAWRGVDLGSNSDTWLESPTLEAGAGPLVVRLSHRYRFEADEPDGSDTNWDGAVIEVSGDDGATWEDISTYVDIGYRGTLTGRSGNPLADRRAFVGTSTAWPNRQLLVLDMKRSFSGQRVRLRFRIGTDASVGDFGWEIDDISVEGIQNAPFVGLGPDTTICPERLVADAGPDFATAPGFIARLDGSASRSAENLPLAFTWTQTGGPPVPLEDGATARPFFVAPLVPAEIAELRFELEVSDGTRTATDAVTIALAGSERPMARAGPDRTVAPGAGVVLDGSASSADPRLIITYAWRQLSGPTVELAGSMAPTAGFTAPVLDTESTIELELEVTDGTRSSTDTVSITVRATDAPAPLSVEAGPAQSVADGATVVLQGAVTGDPSLPVTSSWTQIGGPSVRFASNTGATAVFVAEAGEAERTLRFELAADDGLRSATDTATVTVAALPPETPDPMGGGDDVDGGCSCAATAIPSSGPGGRWALALLFGILFVRQRRRSGSSPRGQSASATRGRRARSAR